MFTVRWFLAWLIGVALLGGGALHSTTGNVAENVAGLGQSPQPTAFLAIEDPGIPPTLTLTPTSGPAGTMVTAAGSGYDECLDSSYDGGGSSDGTPVPASEPEPPPPPSGQVALFWDEVEQRPWADVSDDATFTTRFTAPASAAPGTHVVVSRCAGSPTAPILATATFTIPTPPIEQTTLVPNLVGLPPGEAPAALQKAGLELGRTSGSGEVIDSQEPPARTRVPLGSTVNISLVPAPARGQPVRVPDLVGRTVNEARMALATVNLILGNNPPDGNSRIRGQTPDAGTLVAQGTRVTVIVSEVAPPPSPGGPAAGGQVPPGAAPTTAQSTSTGQPAPTSQSPGPPSSTVPATPKAVSWFTWWGFLIVVVLILLGLLGSMLIRRLSQRKRAENGPTWVRSHVRFVTEVDHHNRTTVTEPRVGHSPTTRVVRIIPHHDSGRPVLEVVKQ